MTSEQPTADITRKEWVDLYNQGFKYGQQERKKKPKNRQKNVETRLEDIDNYQPPDLEALQQGYDLGRTKGVPGAKIDVDEKANTAFDRSDYGADLSRWSD